MCPRQIKQITLSLAENEHLQHLFLTIVNPFNHKHFNVLSLILITIYIPDIGHQHILGKFLLF